MRSVLLWVFILILVFILVINYKGTSADVGNTANAGATLISRLQGFGPNGNLHTT